MKTWLGAMMVVTALAAAANEPTTNRVNKEGGAMATNKVQFTDAEWKAKLTPEQYRILRQQGTERAFSGKLWNHFEDGQYRCAGCGELLFTSESKFDSHCGWPSFDRPMETNAVEFIEDRSHGMARTEVRCKRCGGHLGHVFDDGPTATGQRFCINSVSIGFEKREKSDKK